MRGIRDDRMGLASLRQSECRVCGRMCDSAFVSARESDVICHECLEKRVDVPRYEIMNIHPTSIIQHAIDQGTYVPGSMSYDSVVAEFVAIEGLIYEILSSAFMTLAELSLALSKTAFENGFTLFGRSIDGLQADELVIYFCKGYYRRYQRYYRHPEFREKYLDALERNFPERKLQVAVAKDPLDPSVWKVRKRVFPRLMDRYGLPSEIKVKGLRQLSNGCYLYGDSLDDPEKIWIDSGAIEVFLDLLCRMKRTGVVLEKWLEELPDGWYRKGELRKFGQFSDWR